MEEIDKSKWLDDDKFDLIILGTGLTESILAGAVSRIEKKVLHLDRNDYYGGHFANFPLKQFEGLLKDASNISRNWEQNANSSSSGNEILVNASLKGSESENWGSSMLFNTHSSAFKVFKDKVSNEESSENKTNESQVEENSTKTEEKEEAEEQKNENVENPKEEKEEIRVEEKEEKEVDPLEELMKESRGYNIDLIPKYYLANGLEIATLVSSGVSTYLEFKLCDGMYMATSDGIQLVPCSQSDVFKSKYIGLLEKRHLTKFIEAVIQSKNNSDNSTPSEINLDVPFIETLKEKKLSEKLQKFILYAIVFAEEDQNSDQVEKMSTREGFDRIHRYINSIGKYGPSPFLAQLYGNSELPQAFCRMCAVFGGIYVLRRTVQKILLNEQKEMNAIIDSEGQTLYAPHFVSSIDYLPQFTKAATEFISRAIVISDRPIIENKEQIVLSVPPGLCGNKNTIQIIGNGPTLGVCPKNKFLYHFVTRSNGSSDLESAVKHFFHVSSSEESSHPSKPTLLYSSYFDLPILSLNPDSSVPSNVHFCNSNDSSVVGCEEAFKRAKELFEKMFPDQPFLPKMPNPDHVVWESEPESSSSTTNVETPST
eukprot:TRINITY_DN3229_c0_g1_i1.p1 TRINITY_DN3229_c0_g1~~TRINITY_DN3229_c0_g1_i1.p1  ORF type:complete len:607 (+),score=242.03 TRINITY_DN3229_c0_g1_i1:30-1823(+)